MISLRSLLIALVNWHCFLCTNQHATNSISPAHKATFTYVALTNANSTSFLVFTVLFGVKPNELVKILSSP